MPGWPATSAASAQVAGNGVANARVAGFGGRQPARLFTPEPH